MPWGDWQFWVVSAVFVVALGAVVRMALPRRRGSGTCASCGPAKRPRGRKVELTVKRSD